MRERALQLLGLMRRAGAIAIGETHTGTAVKGGRAKLLLVAADASDNARKRAAGFAAGRRVLTVPLPFTKEELSAHLGVYGCSMAAVLDAGFAGAFMQLLAQQWPETYGETAREAQRRSERTRQRQQAAAQERNKRIGKRRSSV